MKHRAYVEGLSEWVAKLECNEALLARCHSALFVKFKTGQDAAHADGVLAELLVELDEERGAVG